MTDRKRVLVTGANGHLGRRLVTHLAPTYRVRAIVRSERARRQLEQAAGPKDAEINVLDYGDRDGLAAAARECAYAVHLVGIIKESATSRYEEAHEATARALADAADAAQMERVINLSILGSDAASTNPCLASKARAEQILLEARTPAVVLRVPMVLGENDYASMALKRRARNRVNVLLRGASREQPIYAGDVVDAIAASLTCPGLDNVIVELAGPLSLTRRALIRRAGELTGHRPRSLSIPLGIGIAAAFLLELISSNPPVTRAMLRVLDHDDEIDSTEAVSRLGIELTPLDEMLIRCA